jgi:glyoxylase-like metal-dependent hydrolase (beta-lactamase superfamily II)
MPALLLIAVASAFAQPSDEIRTLQVRSNVYMLSRTGGNITVLTGPDGLLLVDTGAANMTDSVIAALRKLSDKPVLYIINTSADADHTGGNEKIAAAGKTLTGGNVAGDIADAAEGAAVFAHENVLNRMSAAKTPFRAIPTDTYHTDQMRLSPLFHFGEAVQIVYQPSAHTDGDSIVYFRRSDVIATGDVFSTDRYPVIDLKTGGSINGVIDGLNRILDLAFPEFRLEGGTMIVPGHGRLCDSADVAYYRDMVTIVRDRIQDLIRKDRTLEQVKAAKPTSDYDPRYGNGDAFVESVYNSLTRSRAR